MFFSILNAFKLILKILTMLKWSTFTGWIRNLCEYLVENRCFQMTLYIVFVITNIIYIISIIIGSLYLYNRCPVQSFIPIW